MDFKFDGLVPQTISCPFCTILLVPQAEVQEEFDGDWLGLEDEEARNEIHPDLSIRAEKL